MNIILILSIILYTLLVLNIYVIIEIYNYNIKKIKIELYSKLYTELATDLYIESVSDLYIESASDLPLVKENLVEETEETVETILEHNNIYECVNVAQNNYAIDLYFNKNMNVTFKFNTILSSLKDELNTCNILYTNILNTFNTSEYDVYTMYKQMPLSKCDEEYFYYYIYNIYSGEICNEFETLTNDCSQFNIIALILGLERCNNIL